MITADRALSCCASGEPLPTCGAIAIAWQRGVGDEVPCYLECGHEGEHCGGIDVRGPNGSWRRARIHWAQGRSW